MGNANSQSWANLYAEQWEETGDGETQLRTLAHADDEDAVEPPTVGEFTTERLGTGLTPFIGALIASMKVNKSVMSYGNVKALLVRAVIWILLGFVAFIGGIIAIIAKSVTLSGVLLALSIASLCVAMVFMLMLRSRARIAVGNMRAKREADMARLRREHPGLRDS